MFTGVMTMRAKICRNILNLGMMSGMITGAVHPAHAKTSQSVTLLIAGQPALLLAVIFLAAAIAIYGPDKRLWFQDSL